MKFHANPIGEIPQFDLTVDGVFIKRFKLKKNEVVPQHGHHHSHVTILGYGRVRVWRGEDPNHTDYLPGMIYIEAYTKHQFLALEDSELYCVHNSEHALIASENRLELV